MATRLLPFGPRTEAKPRAAAQRQLFPLAGTSGDVRACHPANAVDCGQGKRPHSLPTASGLLAPNASYPFQAGTSLRAGASHHAPRPHLSRASTAHDDEAHGEPGGVRINGPCPSHAAAERRRTRPRAPGSTPSPAAAPTAPPSSSASRTSGWAPWSSPSPSSPSRTSQCMKPTSTRRRSCGVSARRAPPVRATALFFAHSPRWTAPRALGRVADRPVLFARAVPRVERQTAVRAPPPPHVTPHSAGEASPSAHTARWTEHDV